MITRLRKVSRLSAVLLLVVSAGVSVVLPTIPVGAEGTHQMNEQQVLSSSTAVYVDVLSAGETINISLCENLFLGIYDVQGTPADLSDDVLVDTPELTANLDCEQPLPNSITNAYKFTPESIGTYRIDISDGSSQRRYDFTVTSNSSVAVNPASSNGRVWSYLWRFSANDDVAYENEYPEETSTDADLYALVPAPNPSEHFVWKLDLNNFAGGSYRLMANNTGLNAPYSGVSAWMDEATVTPMYPLYLGYPEVAGGENTTTPEISGLTFSDDEEEDNTFSPGATPGIQDEGNFVFNSSVAGATYAITIDTNKDGIYGTGDRLLLGSAVQGLNTVNWDGNYANGDPVAVGNYNARLQLRIGEFHFIARDVEASGGTHNGTTWANGLTIYKALSQNTTANTTVYWDDLTALSIMEYNEDTDSYTPNGKYADATSNLPNGVTSGSTADANNDGKADGFHTWGDFKDDSMGNENYIDTFTYGEVDTDFTTLSVATVDGTDTDGVSSGIEAGAPNNGDGNGDGIADHLQNEVTSLPNKVSGGYNTVAVEGCTALSRVSVASEAELSVQDLTYGYPVGLLNFDITCENPGDTAIVTVVYDKQYDTTNWQARKFTNGQYDAIDGAVFANQVIGGKTVTTLTYSLTDGGPLDEDGLANGTIVDPVGPGNVSTNPGVPNTGMNTLNIQSIVAMLVAGTAFGIGAILLARRVTAHSRR